MKVADVAYEGPMRHQNYRCGETGNRYTFKRGQPRGVESLEDAREFASHPNTFDVDWTAHGFILRETDEKSPDNLLERISEYGYRKKQELAKSLGIKANQKEEELQEELEEQVESLQKQLENS